MRKHNILGTIILIINDLKIECLYVRTPRNSVIIIPTDSNIAPHISFAHRKPVWRSVKYQSSDLSVADSYFLMGSLKKMRKRPAKVKKLLGDTYVRIMYNFITGNPNLLSKVA